MQKTRQNKTALCGVLIALAMILSYIETLIPISIGVPGVKIGLPNLVTFFALYQMTAADAFAISLVRVVLVGFTFGSMSAMLYSLAGALASLAVMYVCRKRDWMGPVGVSMAGGVFHNIGQLITAALVLESAAVFSYLPVLLAAGAAAGALVGFLGGLVAERVRGPEVRQ